MNSAFKLSVVLAFLVASSSLQASLPRPLTILKGAAALGLIVYKVITYHTAEHQKVDQQISLLQIRQTQLAQATDLRSLQERATLAETISALRVRQEQHS